MSRRIDAHHHLWDLHAVTYPWLMAKGVVRFFGDPTPIQRDYLLEEFRRDAQAAGFSASVHIQVGASDGFEEAKSVQQIADANPDWPLVQVVFCDLTSKDLNAQLDAYQAMSTVRGVRQIVGRASLFGRLQVVTSDGRSGHAGGDPLHHVSARRECGTCCRERSLPVSWAHLRL